MVDVCHINTNTRNSALSLCFNCHFPGEPGLASVYWSKGWWRWWWQLDYWSYKSCNCHQRNNIQYFFTGRMPFRLSNQQCQSTEGKISYSMDLLTPSSPGSLPTLSLTTNSSWLAWGRVAMPLISPLMPVQQIQETQLSLTNCARNLCNGVAYPSKTWPSHVTTPKLVTQHRRVWA